MSETASSRKKILMVASNPATSQQTGWPIGVWWAELTHAYKAFTDAGYLVTIASPEGGALGWDGLSDPEDPSGYSADDALSLEFKNDPGRMALTRDTPALREIDLKDYDAVFFVGGQGPMYTFIGNDDVHAAVADFLAEDKPTALVCHATSVLLTAKDRDGTLIVDGRRWTGFASSEEQIAEDAVGQRIQPFWIEDEARKIGATEFVVGDPFQPFAVRDGNLITGQNQNSATEAAKLVIEALER